MMSFPFTASRERVKAFPDSSTSPDSLGELGEALREILARSRGTSRPGPRAAGR